MKKIKALFLALPFLFLSCSSDDGGGSSQPDFAMTATINGTAFKANNPYGDNMFSSTNIWSYYPEEDFVMLQGRQGGILGNPEINIWLKKSQLVVGTVAFGSETFDTPPSHYIDLIDNAMSESQYTKGGSITITSVNTSSHIVKGTFQFTSAASADPSAPVTVTVTDGTFNYQYQE